MKVEDIRQVLILGAGTMGMQIGFQCAIHGYDVVYYDVSEEILGKTLERAAELGSWMVAKGRFSQEDLDRTLGRLTVNPDPVAAAKDADIVSESVPENPVLKGKIFRQFHDLCPDRTIFTTNTSTLLPSLFADATGRSERLCALHFHDVKITNVVDVMPHPGTDPEITQVVADFAKRIGQTVIMLNKENNGYVFNAMISTLCASALTLATRNVASLEDIDRAWMGIMHTPFGPFGMMDQVGLSTVWHVTDYWAKQKNDPQASVNAEFLKQYVDQGRLGIKTKRGFYSYPNPAYAEPGFLTTK